MGAVGVLAGLPVMELAQFVFVPGVGVLLADQSAEVIKVETPGHGDPYRTLQVGDGREVSGINLAMEQNNRGKKSIAFDLKTEQGREVFLEQSEIADVFITSLRPRAIRALKLDVADLRARNPNLIYACGNGLGFRGDEADKPGFDASAFWARGGMSYAFTLPGNEPTPPGPALGAHSSATSLAFAIAGTLYKRKVTGSSSVVEISLLQKSFWMLSSDVTYSQTPRYTVHSNFKVRFPLMSAYRTKDDRLIQLMLLDPRQHWASLCALLDINDLVSDLRLADNIARMRQADEFAAILAGRFAIRSLREWRPILEVWDAPWEVIQTVADFYTDRQVLANYMIFSVQMGENKVSLVSDPATFDSEAKLVSVKGSPSMGEHTSELLREVGCSGGDISDFRLQRIVQ